MQATMRNKERESKRKKKETEKRRDGYRGREVDSNGRARSQKSKCDRKVQRKEER